MHPLSIGASRRGAFGYSVIVSWEELTSSKLIAQSYEEAVQRALPLIPYPLSLIPRALALFMLIITVQETL